MTAMRLPWSALKMWFSSVVLPALAAEREVYITRHKTALALRSPLYANKAAGYDSYFLLVL